jgi:serine O-acetyltransferase
MKLGDVLREDIRVFRLVRPRKGVLKYIYYPDFRTVVLFRVSQRLFQYRPLRPVAYFITVLNDLIAGVWIGPQVQIGPGLFLGHARGLVVNPTAKIGRYCSIMQRVTIGGPQVTIGDYTEINSGAQIVSNVRGDARLSVGSYCIIGAGAVVVHDVPDFSVVVGVPGKVVRTISPSENWVEYRRRRNEAAKNGEEDL